MKCPWCGAPVQIRGNTWECGYCGDHGRLCRKPQYEKGDFSKGCLYILAILAAVALLATAIVCLSGYLS